MADGDSNDLDAQATEIVARNSKKIERFRAEMAEKGITVTDDQVAEMLAIVPIQVGGRPRLGRERRGSE
jgi:hypothetical protein